MEKMSYRGDVGNGMYYAYGDKQYIPAVTFAEMWNEVPIDVRIDIIVEEFEETIFDKVDATPMGNVRGHRYMNVGEYPARGDVFVFMWNEVPVEEKERIIEIYKDGIGLV